jgi:hypothetical protein
MLKAALNHAFEWKSEQGPADGERAHQDLAVDLIPWPAALEVSGPRPWSVKSGSGNLTSSGV